MTLLNFRSALALFGLITTVALVPNTASARGSVHVDIPGFSIGLHDTHWGHGRKYKRHHKRHYRKHHKRQHYYRGHRGYRGHGYHGYGHRNYYDGYGHGYKKRHYAPRNYYYGRSNYCPTAGYSDYPYDNRNCYPHKGHYHCD